MTALLDNAAFHYPASALNPSSEGMKASAFETRSTSSEARDRVGRRGFKKINDISQIADKKSGSYHPRLPCKFLMLVLRQRFVVRAYLDFQVNSALHITLCSLGLMWE